MLDGALLQHAQPLFHSACDFVPPVSLLFATGASGIVWELLLNLRIVHSKRTIKESGRRWAHPPPTGGDRRTTLV